jgi:hypothetical protein
MSEESTALPAPERSSLGPLAGCAVLLILLAAAAGGGWLVFQRQPAPVLETKEGRWVVSFQGLGELKLVLGPGCSDPRLTEIEDEVALAWQSEGREVLVSIHPDGEGDFFVGIESVEPGQSIILLPEGRAHIVDTTLEPLLMLRRWEGALAGGDRCVVWKYDHSSFKQPSFTEYTVDDGQDLGLQYHSDRTTGPGSAWTFSESYSNASREAHFFEGKRQATYKVVIGGKAQSATLEQTYEGGWSEGDPLPSSAGY